MPKRFETEGWLLLDMAMEPEAYLLPRPIVELCVAGRYGPVYPAGFSTTWPSLAPALRAFEGRRVRITIEEVPE